MRSRIFGKAQRGISLLEVLIAILILAIGALGFAGLQMKALHTTNDANYRARAMLLAQDAIERIQANPTQLDNYQAGASWSNPGTPGSGCTGASICEPSAMLAEDIAQLTHSAATTLPNGQILTSPCPFNGMSCVTVSWGDQGLNDCMGGGGIDSAQSQCLVMEFGR